MPKKSRATPDVKVHAKAYGKAGLELAVERSVNSWRDLAAKIEMFAGSDWIFRGVPDKSFDLIPKIARPGTRKSPKTRRPLRYSEPEEKRMFEEFKRLARPYLPQGELPVLELLAIARHHGLPTRLLDWTDSLLVAAYFALEEAGTRRNPPAIYAIKALRAVRGDEDPFDSKAIPDIVIYRPPHISPRIPAQRSLFTIHPHPDGPPLKPLHVERLILPRRPDALEIKDRLDDCAINRASLFPDLDGLANYIAWRHKWGKLG
jgi:hypothetical protein